MNAFEEEIGGRLFVRRHNRYELTSMGEELLALAQNIANSIDDIERHIVGKDFHPKGTVKITAPINIACRFLPRYLVEFNHLHPDINVEILSSNAVFNMSNRQADIAVRATSSPPEHLVGRKVSSIRWSVYGSRAYEYSYGLPKRADDLQNHVLIGATGELRNLPAFTWLEKTLSQNIVSRCDELLTMSYFVQSGLGLALLPDDQQRPEIKKLFTLKVVKSSDLWLLTHPDIRNVARIKLLMQHLGKSFNSEQTLYNAASNISQ